MRRQTPAPPVAPLPAPREATVRPIWDDAPAEPEPQETPAAGPGGPAWTALARGVALLFGTLLAVDLFGADGLPEGGPWWLDTRPLPAKAATGLLALGAASLVAFGVRPALPRPVRWIATLSLVLLIALALKNATIYYGLLKRGDLHAGPPVAFPLHVAACLGVVLIAVRSAPRRGGVKDLFLTAVGFNAAILALPVAHIACCGPVDSRRPAAAVVVFGPRPFEDDAEARADERLRKAIELHREGLVPKLLLAGAEGDRLARLKKLAADAGLAEAAVETLPPGDETALLKEAESRFPAAQGTLLAVSDCDHLPRVAQAARRAGVSISTVPAKPPERVDSKVLAREAVELWRLYFRR